MTAESKNKKAAAKAVKKEVSRELRREKRAASQGMLAQNVKTNSVAMRNMAARTIIKKSKERINWYLIELLDPSRWEEALAHGVRGIPDFYSHRSHVFVTRTVEDLDTNNFDANGKCFIKNTASMLGHLHHSGNAGVLTQYEFTRLYSTNASFEFVDTNNKSHSLPTLVDRSTALANTASYALPTSGNLECHFGTPGCKTLMANNAKSIAFDYSTDYHYTIGAGASNQVEIFFKLWEATAGAGTVEVSVVTDQGTRVGSLATAAGFRGGKVSVTLNAADTQIQKVSIVNKTGGAIIFSDIQSRILVLAPSDFTSLTSHSVQNYERIASDFQAVRPVCGYMWTKYRGSLTTNGSIAGALVDSISNPVATDVMSYDQIAGLLSSYEGSVVNGMYQIWCPMNPADTNFTTVNDTRMEAPYIVAGLDVNDVSAQSIRVECYWVWEGLTQQQMYATEPGSVDIEMMNDAFAKLSHFDKSMENDLHLKAIAQFLGSGVKKGVDFARKMAQTPAGKAAIASAAAKLLEKASTYGPTVANAARMAMNAAQAIL